MARTDREKNQNQKCLNSFFLLLIFPFRDLFLLLIQTSQGFSQGLKRKKFLRGRFLSYSKKRKISRNDHSLLFIVTRCTTRCHSLYHTLLFVVPLVVIFLSLVVSLAIAPCLTRLSFYKWSCKTFYFRTLLFIAIWNQRKMWFRMIKI